MDQLKRPAITTFLAAVVLWGLFASSPAFAHLSPADNSSPNTENGERQGKPHRLPFRHSRGGHLVKDTAAMLGMEPKELLDRLRKGKSLMQVVQAEKGWSEVEYIKKLTEAASRHLDEAVTEGKLAPEQAAKIKQRLPDKLNKIIHRTWKNGTPGHPALDMHHNHIVWPNPDFKPADEQN
ncbi:MULTISPECIES: hypothetical protein [Paenibacillus]|uniref:hypothetical protein n=1 Tax=Paenibacillus TaxID=44249 RepID=UPI002FDF5E97